MTLYTREYVQTHSDRGPSRPAVNVKVYTTMQDAWTAFAKDETPDPRFTLDWIEENVSEEALGWVFSSACESESEYLIDWATGADDDGLFPDDRVKLWHEGRQGGWIVVDGLPEIEEWDAIRLARWRKFERIAREIAAGIPYQMLSSIYIKQFEQWSDEQDAAAIYNKTVPVDLHPVL